MTPNTIIDHHGHDPHAWLDPQNARVWLDVIAADLSALDPENATTYSKNAEEGKKKLDGLMSDVKAELADVKDKHFVVFHDAYQYFEHRSSGCPQRALSAWAMRPIRARRGLRRSTIKWPS